MLVVFVVLFVSCWVPSASPAQNLGHDERCSCKCPETAWIDDSINPDFPERKIYINATVRAADCDCEHVVKPVLDLNQEQVDKFCPRCDCRHEERSTITIKIVVILILWILAMLVLYLVFLLCIEPLISKKPRVQVRRGTNLAYQQQTNENTLDNDTNVNSTPLRDYPAGGDGAAGTSGGRASSVVNRLGREQDKWKRQVEVQRSTVYDRHSMLN